MEKIKSLFTNLKSFRWNMWIALCALSLIPATYQTIRTALAYVNTSASGIDIIEQMEWYDLIDETLKALLIIPLYSILNRVNKEDNKNFSRFTFIALIIVFSLYFIFNIGVFFYGTSLIKAMNPSEVNIVAIKQYLELETIAFMIGIIPTFFNVIFVTINKAKNVYIFLIIQAILGIIGDFILIPNLGVNGIAINNIITNSILAVAVFITLFLEKQITPSWFNKGDSKLIANWCKIGLFSGLQQFIDNIVYALMISRMVNLVAESGNYWVANNFIWGWLLIPISALSEIIKSDYKEEKNANRSNYLMIVTFSIITWIITIPLWKPFLRYVEQIDNYQDIFSIIIKLWPFYIAYSLCIIPDSIFIGKGKTQYILINSILVNFVYYGIWFILYITNSIQFNMLTIIMMFGFGMVFHLIISLVELWVFDKKNKFSYKHTSI